MTLILLVALSVAVECVDYTCTKVSYEAMKNLVRLGALELIFEVYGFIKIYKRAGEE